MPFLMSALLFDQAITPGFVNQDAHSHSGVTNSFKEEKNDIGELHINHEQL
jgi:hypothetical protein